MRGICLVTIKSLEVSYMASNGGPAIFLPIPKCFHVLTKHDSHFLLVWILNKHLSLSRIASLFIFLEVEFLILETAFQRTAWSNQICISNLLLISFTFPTIFSGDLVSAILMALFCVYLVPKEADKHSRCLPSSCWRCWAILISRDIGKEWARAGSRSPAGNLCPPRFVALLFSG